MWFKKCFITIPCFFTQDYPGFHIKVKFNFTWVKSKLIEQGDSESDIRYFFIPVVTQDIMIIGGHFANVEILLYNCAF